MAYTRSTDLGSATVIAEITDSGLVETVQKSYEELLVGGGKGGGGYYVSYEKYLLFAPDSKTLIYPARKNLDQYFMVIGTSEGESFDRYVWFPIISKNRKSVGYVAQKGNDIYWVEHLIE